MDLSTGALLASLAVNALGLGLFLYGKKLRRIPQAAGGILLMAGPYFLPGALWILLFGAAVTAGVWFAARADA